MTYKLIKKFFMELHGHEPVVLTGPFTPFIVLTPWVQNIVDVLMIQRGRESLIAFDEHLYRLCGENRLRQYLAKEVSKVELENEYYRFSVVTQSMYDEALRLDFVKADEEALILFLKKIIRIFEMMASTIYIETPDYEMVLKVVGQNNKRVLDAVWEHATNP